MTAQTLGQVRTTRYSKSEYASSTAHCSLYRLGMPHAWGGRCRLHRKLWLGAQTSCSHFSRSSSRMLR